MFASQQTDSRLKFMLSNMQGIVTAYAANPKHQSDLTKKSLEVKILSKEKPGVIIFNTHEEAENAIKAEKFLVVVHGSGDELAKAEFVLNNIGHDLQIHAA